MFTRPSSLRRADLGPGPLAASGIENLSMVEWNNLYEIERIEEQPPASYAAGVQ